MDSIFLGTVNNKWDYVERSELGPTIQNSLVDCFSLSSPMKWELSQCITSQHHHKNSVKIYIDNALKNTHYINVQDFLKYDYHSKIKCVILCEVLILPNWHLQTIDFHSLLPIWRLFLLAKK